ncbi:hypothetical protein KY336_00240 [Candidatus Woesearchaeota archaeon]|nr:hypothetical protein [Candidatus Woesearchaeota archaeon]
MAEKPIEIADLHIHSRESMENREEETSKTQKEVIDDIVGPREFTRQTYQGQEVVVKAIAFTEHDTITEDIKEVVEYGAKRGIQVIPAVELDCNTNRFEEIHINILLFGNLVDIVLEDEEFKAELAKVNTGRRKTCEIMMSELKRHGVIKSDVSSEGIRSKPEIYKILRDPSKSMIADKFSSDSDAKIWTKRDGYDFKRDKPNAHFIAHQLAKRLGLPFSIEHSRMIFDKQTKTYISNRDRKELIKYLSPWAIQVYYPYIFNRKFRNALDLTKEKQTEWEEEDSQWLTSGSGTGIINPIGGSDFHKTGKNSRNANRVAEAFITMDYLIQLEREFYKRMRKKKSS